MQGNRLLVQNNPATAIARQFIEGSGDAAAGWVTHPPDARASRRCQRFNQRQYGTRVGAKISREIELAARQQDSDAVIADWTGEQNFVARTNRPRIDLQPSYWPANSGCGYVHEIGFAMFDDFGVATRDGDAGFARSISHGAHFALQNGRGQAGFEYVGDYHGL